MFQDKTLFAAVSFVNSCLALEQAERGQPDKEHYRILPNKKRTRLLDFLAMPEPRLIGATRPGNSNVGSPVKSASASSNSSLTGCGLGVAGRIGNTSGRAVFSSSSLFGTFSGMSFPTVRLSILPNWIAAQEYDRLNNLLSITDAFILGATQ
jgi:hypothetical protein